MRIGRRAVLTGGAVTSGLLAVPAAVRASTQTRIAIFDSRELASRAFVSARRGPSIDVAQEDAAFWRSLSAVAKGQPVEGLTSWSDWVIVRGLLEENGRRVKAEAKAGRLFRWSMS